VVAEPIEMELPPPCNCIEIVGSGVRSKKAGDRGGSIGFKANGDCCDGVYNMDIVVPCPIPKVRKTTIRGEVKFRPTTPPPPDSYVLFSSTSSGGSCVMPQPKSVDLKMELPCPIKLLGEGKVNISAVYKDDARPKSFVIGKGDTLGCTMEVPQRQDIVLEIPQPVVMPPGGGAGVHISIKCGERTLASASSNLLDIKGLNPNTGSQIVAKSANLDLKLDCPVKKVGDGDPRIRLVVRLGTKSLLSESATFLKINEQQCLVEAQNPSFDLNIPCPVKGPSGDRKLRIKYKDADGDVRYASGVYATVDASSCTAEFKELSLDITDIGGGGGMSPGSITTSDYFVTGTSYGSYSGDWKFRITKKRMKIVWSSRGITYFGTASSSPQITYINTTPLTMALQVPTA
jgi:hypothetical protein